MHISEPCVFDAVLRMRTNAGIRPVEFCGNFMMQNATDMEIAVLKPTSCVTIEIKHDDKLCEDFQAYVQVQMLALNVSLFFTILLSFLSALSTISSCRSIRQQIVNTSNSRPYSTYDRSLK